MPHNVDVPSMKVAICRTCYSIIGSPSSTAEVSDRPSSRHQYVLWYGCPIDHCSICARMKNTYTTVYVTGSSPFIEVACNICHSAGGRLDGRIISDTDVATCSPIPAATLGFSLGNGEGKRRTTPLNTSGGISDSVVETHTP